MVNGKYFIHISYRRRIICLGIYFFLGYNLLSLVLILNARNIIGDKLGFVLTMIPSLIMGTGSAFGEATIMGCLRNYPKNLINGWGSGTGMAGIIGAILTIFFKMFNIKTQFLYLFTSPLSLIYLAIFLIQENVFNNHVLSKRNKTSNASIDLTEKRINEEDLSDGERVSNNLNVINQYNNSSDEKNLSNKDSSTDNNTKLNLHNFKLAFSYSKTFIINLALVNKINLY
jgi:hypothetical protein